MDHHRQAEVHRSQKVNEAVGLTKTNAGQIGRHNFDAVIDHLLRKVLVGLAVSRGDYLGSLSGLVFHSRLESDP